MILHVFTLLNVYDSSFIHRLSPSKPSLPLVAPSDHPAPAFAARIRRPPTTIVCKAREYILRIHYFHLLDPQLLLLFGVDTSSGDSVNELLEGGIAYFTEYNTYHPHSAVCPCIFGKFAHSPIRGLIAVFEEIEIIGTGIH